MKWEYHFFFGWHIRSWNAMKFLCGKFEGPISLTIKLGAFVFGFSCHSWWPLEKLKLRFDKNSLVWWWQLKYFWFSTRSLGKMNPILTSIFFRWVESNHQPGKFGIVKSTCYLRGSCVACSMVAHDLLVKPDMFDFFLLGGKVWGVKFDVCSVGHVRLATDELEISKKIFRHRCSGEKLNIANILHSKFEKKQLGLLYAVYILWFF